MKKIIAPICVLLFSDIAHAQLSSLENYVYTKTYLDYNVATASKTAETVQYFDGLGRPKQVVNIKASPQQKDVVSHIEYDGFGRQIKDFLPVPQSNTLNGGIVIDPLANATQPGIYGSEKIYAQKVLENSPLDRIQQQIQVGNDWSNKPVKFDYDANIAGEVIKYTTTTVWENGATKSTVSNSGSYVTAQLYKTTVTDEDGNKTIEFKNGEGQVLLVRKVLSASENADTYYVYNEYNQLAFVIPPLAAVTGNIDEATLNNLCYQYKYDGRGRLVEKKLPGKGFDPATGIWHWDSMVYDKADRLVATQDANLKTFNKWLFTKYDKFGRALYTGISIDNGNRNAVQDWINNVYGVNIETSGSYTQSGLQIEYANSAYPQNIESILSVNYYDKYPTGTPGFTPTLSGNTVITDDFTQNISTKSLPVASFVKNIEDNNWTKNFTWYDNKGRAIATHSINHLGGYTKTESELDFSGIPKQVVTRHKRLDSDTERVIRESFTYDHQNRLLTHKHKVDNNAEETLAQNEYNELSQLKTKKVGGISVSTPLQIVDYQYNIRGWMTQINNPNDLAGGDLFGYKIKYNQVEGQETPNNDFTNLQVKPKFNGNIAEIDWRTATTTGDNLRRYGYVYDGLNRLLAGFYQKDTNPTAKEYFEKMDYDLNGNITNLKRSASKDGNAFATIIDNLTYTYNYPLTGNRLNSVTDSSTDYRGYPDTSGITINYDSNGNMKNHVDKGIENLDYNYLNLPNYILFNFGLPTRGGIIRNNLSYLYRADGVKLKKIYNYAPANPDGTVMELSTEVIDYIDGFQYKGNGKTGKGIFISLLFYPTTEGYYDFVKNKYIYNYADHLGNTRLSYFHNGSSIEVLEENNYYPFGLKHEGYNPTAGNPAYQYKYNGKELQETGMYDYGARFYMPDIGRWGVIDELAEKSRRFSTYTYALDNPIMFVDPDGREAQQCCGKLWNLTKAYYSGLYEGAKGTLQGTANFVRHPINSTKAMANAMAKDPLGATNSQVKSLVKTIMPITNVYSLGYTTVTKGANAAGKEAGSDLAQKGIELGVAGAFKGAGNLISRARAGVAVGEIAESNLISVKSTAPQAGRSLGITVENGNMSIGGAKSGQFDFVVTESGNLKAGSGHYYLSGQASEVQAAGQITLENGQVTGINNVSGHYAPTTAEASRFNSILSAKGIDTSKSKVTTFQD